MDDKKFISRFETKVRSTILNHRLLKPREKVLVAVSGGKDSTTALYLLKKLGYVVEGLTIDQLLGEHSRRNLGNIQAFCRENGIVLHVVHMRDLYGCSVCYMKSVLDGKGIHMNSCTICGVIRRNILNREAKRLKATSIATGHNMDDEAQTLLMNYVRGDIAAMARSGPKSGIAPDERFVPRIKPLYFCLEEEVKRYSQIRGFPVQYEPCPCSLDSYRTEVKGYLNGFEAKMPGTKESMVRGLVEALPSLRGGFSGANVRSCRLCGEPSSNEVCRSCALVKMLSGSKAVKCEA
ncbi:MAG: TIGR00269 family protein [Candidatus Altiarchaeota archaeon]